MRKAQSGRTLL
jgi:myosin I